RQSAPLLLLLLLQSRHRMFQLRIQPQSCQEHQRLHLNPRLPSLQSRHQRSLVQRPQSEHQKRLCHQSSTLHHSQSTTAPSTALCPPTAPTLATTLSPSTALSPPTAPSPPQSSPPQPLSQTLCAPPF